MNLEKAREVARHIRKDDGAHWNQGCWWQGRDPLLGMPVAWLLEHKCGTTGCVAGWTVALEYPQARFHGTSWVKLPGVALEDIPGLADEILDLTEDQSEWLFDDNRTLDEVLWALENDDPDWDWVRYAHEPDED